MVPLRIVSVQAEALFASHLQPSSTPTVADVREAIHGSLQQLGGRGCLNRVAQEFGDHPIEAVARMAWVLSMLRTPQRKRLSINSGPEVSGVAGQDHAETGGLTSGLRPVGAGVASMAASAERHVAGLR
jgi:hypothetical protein